MVVLYHFLDTIRVNSTTLFAINQKPDPKECKAFDYVFNLAKQLFVLQIKQRKRVGLSSNIIKKIEIVTGEIDTAGDVAKPKKTGRCSSCMEPIKGL